MAFLSRSLMIDLLLTALAPAIWGTTYIVTSQFLPPDRPFIAALLRVLPAGIALLIWSRRFPQRGEWSKAYRYRHFKYRRFPGAAVYRCLSLTRWTGGGDWRDPAAAGDAPRLVR